MSARTMVLGDRPLIVRNGLTASGASRATALQLNGDWNRITSVPVDGNGVRLPPAVVGARILVIRADYTNSNRLAVHPMAGDHIGPGYDVLVMNTTAGAGALAVQEFYCSVDGTWDTEIAAASVDSVADCALVGAGVVSVTTAIYKIGVCALAGLGATSPAAVHKSPTGAATPAGHGVVSCIGPN